MSVDRGPGGATNKETCPHTDLGFGDHEIRCYGCGSKYSPDGWIAPATADGHGESRKGDASSAFFEISADEYASMGDVVEAAANWARWQRAEEWIGDPEVDLLKAIDTWHARAK